LNISGIQGPLPLGGLSQDRGQGLDPGQGLGPGQDHLKNKGQGLAPEVVEG